jgi:hypothetical protein
MDPFDIAERWFWAIAIAMTFVNVLMIRFRAKRHIRENPDLATGYSTIIRGLAIWGNIPWIVMGIGCLFGDVPSVWHFLRPSDGNPFVLAFFVSVFVIWILGSIWLFFRNGAELLVRHPGVLNMDFKDPLMLKLMWCVCLAGGIAGVIMVFTQNIPLPDLPD